MAETLNTYFNELLASYQSMRDEALAKLAQTNDELASAIKQHANLVAAYTELEKTIAGKRSAMSAQDLMPADVQILVDELRQLLIDQGAARVAVLTLEDQIAVLENTRDQGAAKRAAIDIQLAEIAAEREEVAEQAGNHAEWALKVSEGEIAELQSKVSELVAIIDGGALDPEAAPDLVAASTAKSRIAGDIPEILRNHAKLRGDYVDAQIGSRQAQLVALRQAIADQQGGDTGVAGAVAQAWLAYDEAEQAYAAIVARGASRLQQAQAQLNAVAASSALTQPEIDRIAAVALAVDHDALVKEQARDMAQAAVAGKVVEIEQAIRAALVADINADPEANAEVIARRSELEGLETALVTAEGEFDAVMQQALALWQGAVPAAIWANFDNYNEAVSVLRDLQAADVNALDVAFADAETALVEALANEHQAFHLLDELEERADLLEGRLKGLENRRDAHRLSAVRGDQGYHSSLVPGELS